MRGRELERLLALVDDIERTRTRLWRAELLTAEVARDERIVAEAPRMAAEAGDSEPAVEGITRTLEEQWVSQGPLVAEWQRAVDLSQQAQVAGMDGPREERAVEAARRDVEAARLSTREEVERLGARRAEVEAALGGAPFDLPTLPPFHTESRPEAARRDALALLAHLAGVRELAAEAEAAARERLDSARAELAAIGDPASLERRLAELRAALPEQVTLSLSTPPSAAVRIERAGVRVERR